MVIPCSMVSTEDVSLTMLLLVWSECIFPNFPNFPTSTLLDEADEMWRGNEERFRIASKNSYSILARNSEIIKKHCTLHLTKIQAKLGTNLLILWQRKVLNFKLHQTFVCSNRRRFCPTLVQYGTSFAPHAFGTKIPHTYGTKNEKLKISFATFSPARCQARMDLASSLHSNFKRSITKQHRTDFESHRPRSSQPVPQVVIARQSGWCIRLFSCLCRCLFLGFSSVLR